MHVIAAKAVCFAEALTEDFNTYQKQIIKNAEALASGLMKRGIKLVSGGTDNHLMLVNLTDEGVTGKELEGLLGKANITVNKNAIPFDKEKPFVTSGLRLGTPAVTSRGMREAEMDIIADCIVDVIRRGEEAVPAVKARVEELTANYPLYVNDVNI